MSKRFDGIRISSHHHVSKSNIVVGGDMTSCNTSKQSLLVEFDIVHGFECQYIVSQQAMDAKQTNYREIAQHSIQSLGTKWTGNRTMSFGMLSIYKQRYASHRWVFLPHVTARLCHVQLLVDS